MASQFGYALEGSAVMVGFFGAGARCAHASLKGLKRKRLETTDHVKGTPDAERPDACKLIQAACRPCPVT